MKKSAGTISSVDLFHDQDSPQEREKERIARRSSIDAGGARHRRVRCHSGGLGL